MVELILLLTAVINLAIAVTNFVIVLLKSRKKKGTSSGASEKAPNRNED